MKRYPLYRYCVLILITLTILLTRNGRAESPKASLEYANQLSNAFEQVAEVITPSVVSIVAVQARQQSRPPVPGKKDPYFSPFREFFGDDFMDRFGGQSPFSAPREGMGTGVLVDKKGHILTNNHVIENTDRITVTLSDRRSVTASVVGSDPRSDLAVIRIDSKGIELIPAKLGDSDKLKIGEWVIAAGNSFGLSNTITAGIVSAKGRSLMGGMQFEDFIQTDAAINPGNSGGPLVNLRGEVVGINTAIFSKSGGYMGIGFAIPIDMARDVMKALLTEGRVVRGWLGVAIQNLTEELSESFGYTGKKGVLVGDVTEGTPAGDAGVKPEDIVLSFNRKTVSTVNELRNLVAGTRPGTKAPLEVFRAGKRKTLTVHVGELESAQVDRKPEEPTSEIGLRLEDLKPEVAEQLGARARQGVLVMSVDPYSIAARAGIQPRDIIISIGGKSVNGVASFNRELSHHDLSKGVRIRVENEGYRRFVFLQKFK